MDKNGITPTFPMPMRGVLLLCGMYTFAWSAFFRYFGESYLKWLSIQPDFISESSTVAFGLTGMLVGFFIFLSAFYPISWRYLILVGIVGHIILLAWFIIIHIPDLGWNKRTVFQLVFNQVLWFGPLAWVLLRAVEVHKYILTIEE